MDKFMNFLYQASLIFAWSATVMAAVHGDADKQQSALLLVIALTVGRMASSK